MSSRLSKDTTRIDKIESPPKLKKLSLMPTLSADKTCAQTCANKCSKSVLGATYSTALEALSPGCGKALRSTLPLVVSGIAFNKT